MKVTALIDCTGLGYDLKTGDTKEVKEDLAIKLIEFGYVEEAPEEAALVDDGETSEIKHVGGGYYELPNGEKVKGKQEATEALKALQEKGDE